MNKREMKIVGEILSLAKDKRSRLMLDDCLKWEKSKMTYIAKLAKMLPYTKAKLNDCGEIVNSVFKKNNSHIEKCEVYVRYRQCNGIAICKLRAVKCERLDKPFWVCAKHKKDFLKDGRYEEVE